MCARSATQNIPYIPVEILVLSQMAARRTAKHRSQRPPLTASWKQVDGKLAYRWRSPVT